MTNVLLLILIAMVTAYFIRENQLRKEQLNINREQMKINKDLAKAIERLAEKLKEK